MAILGLGALMAVNATVLLDSHRAVGIALAVVAFTMIGAGVGAAGTSLLALLASAVAPERRPAAAATTWVMMVAGIVVSAGTAGALLDPFSEQRLALVASGVVFAALALTVVAIRGIERRVNGRDLAGHARPAPPLAEALREIGREQAARRFTLFIFVSMLAYSMQDLILEPFAGLVFGMSPVDSPGVLPNTRAA